MPYFLSEVDRADFWILRFHQALHIDRRESSGRVSNLDILTQASVLGGRARYVGLGNIAGP